jgi:hypothetical protein
MATAQAGAYVRAADIIDTIEADLTSDTSVGSAAANFTLVSAVVRTALGGHLVDFTLYITTDNAITATNGNFADVAMFTLDAAYRPSEVKNACAGTGSSTGEATLSTAGVVTLRSASDSLAAGANIRVNFTYLIP